MNDSQVGFGYKDYRDGKRKSRRLPAEEFIRWFFLHVLPSGFMRARRKRPCGVSATMKLEVIRALVNPPPAADEQAHATESLWIQEPQGSQGPEPLGCLCPKCKQGRLRVCYEIAPKRQYQS